MSDAPLVGDDPGSDHPRTGGENFEPMKSPFILTLIVLSGLCVILAAVYATIQCKKPRGGAAGDSRRASQGGGITSEGDDTRKERHTHMMLFTKGGGRQS